MTYNNDGTKARGYAYAKIECVSVRTYLSNQTVSDGVAHSKNPRKCYAYHVTFDLDLDLEHALDALHADLESIL